MQAFDILINLILMIIWWRLIIVFYLFIYLYNYRITYESKVLMHATSTFVDPRWKIVSRRGKAGKRPSSCLESSIVLYCHLDCTNPDLFYRSSSIASRTWSDFSQASSTLLHYTIRQDILLYILSHLINYIIAHLTVKGLYQGTIKLSFRNF